MPPTDTTVLEAEVVPPAPTTPATNAIAVRDPESILRFAIESKADVGVIERMMAVRKELRSEQAKEAFDIALAAFQAECPTIEKRKAVKERGSDAARYWYAPLDDIVSQVREPLGRNGFSYSHETGQETGWVEAICIATHRLGHSKSAKFKVPIDPKAYMSEPQKYASALTFAKRYTFCAVFGIMTGDEDNDAAGKPEKPPGPSALGGNQAPSKEDQALKRKLVDSTRNIHLVAKGYALTDDARAKLTQWLIEEAVISDTETVSDLAGKRLAEVVSTVEAKLTGK